MDDFKNHKFYYLMWLPKAKNIIWDAQNKKSIPKKHNIEGLNLYVLLKNEIDLGYWRRKYTHLYQNWLNHDRPQLFDLQHSVHTQMVEAIRKVNEKLPVHIHLGYWYDVDRQENENFVWEHSPFSQKPLWDLGEHFFAFSRLWDHENYLIFPKN